FSSRRRHTRSTRDWSSDVCSSDLPVTDRTLNPGYSLVITNVATDSDTPPQTLTFNLLSAPTNATLGASSGVLSWRPLISQADTRSEERRVGKEGRASAWRFERETD